MDLQRTRSFPVSAELWRLSVAVHRGIYYCHGACQQLGQTWKWFPRFGDGEWRRCLSGLLRARVKGGASSTWECRPGGGVPVCFV